MNGSEFIRKVEKPAKSRNLVLQWNPSHGKGGHGRLILGTRSTMIKDPKRSWAIRRDPEGKDYVVTFPDLRGAITGAATREEAVDGAADCLASWPAFAIADRKAVPAPSHLKRGQFAISVPFWIAPKVVLYTAMYDQGISNSELARRLKVSESVVRRMLDPDHATKSAKLEAALKAVGRHLYMVSAA